MLEVSKKIEKKLKNAIKEIEKKKISFLLKFSIFLI